MEELVFKSKKGNVVTTSLLVAMKFEKNHRDVLEAIRNLITSADNSAVLSMFYETTYLNEQNKKQPMFIMNRDGFTLLAMRFTGKKALAFQIEYIDSFNKMEVKLKSLVQLPDFNDPVAAARAWADEREQRVFVEAKNKQLADKASYADRVLTNDNDFVDIGQAAKLLKLPYGRNTFFKRLRADRIFFKNRNEPLQQYTIPVGNYFDMRKVDLSTEERPNFVVKKVLVSSAGLLWLSKKYGGSCNTNLPTLQLQ